MAVGTPGRAAMPARPASPVGATLAVKPAGALEVPENMFM